MKMKSKSFLLVFAVILLCAGNALAAWSHYWKYSAPEPSGNLWSTPGNWSNGAVPTITNTDYAAYQLIGGEDLLLIDNYAECAGFITGGWGGTDITELQNGAYFYLDNLNTGGGAGFISFGEATPETSAPCVFTNNGGDIYVTGQVLVGGTAGTGNGSYVQNAGTLTSGWRLWISADDDVQLNAGTMDVGTLQIDATAVLDIYAGTLRFGGASESELQQYVNQAVTDGRLLAYGGEGTIQSYYDTGLGRMVITADNNSPPPLPPSNLYPSGLIQVQPDVNLHWLPSVEPSTFDVFFGTSQNDVQPGATPVNSGQTPTNYQLTNLKPGQLYFWRVKQVAQDSNSWSPVWTFIVGNFESIEDAEEYSDANAIGNVWSENSNAAIYIDDLNEHWGYRAIRLDYSDINSFDSAYICKEYNESQDWSNDGSEIELWYKGEESNSNQQLYIAVEDSFDNLSVVVNPDINITKTPTWQVWEIPTIDFSRIDLSEVNKFYIGLGQHKQGINPGTGTIYLDDIRLYPEKCSPAQSKYPDFDGDNEISLDDIAIFAAYWVDINELGGSLIVNVTPDCEVDFKDYSVLADNYGDSRKTYFIDNVSTKGLTNGLIELLVDSSSGTLVSLKNLSTGDDYLKTINGDGNPFRCYVNTTQKPPALLQAYPYPVQNVEGSMGGILVDPKNCVLSQSSFSRIDNAGILSLELIKSSPPLIFNLDVKLPDSSNKVELSLQVKNNGSISLNVITAFPYFTGLGLGNDRNTNLGVRLRDFGQSRAPAWSIQGDLYGRGWNGQWNAVYEPGLNEVFGFTLDDPNFLAKIFHRFANGGMSVLYVDNHNLSSLESVSYPPVNLIVNNGDWKVVAAEYRDWFENNFEPRAIPDWLEYIDTFGSGWFPNPGNPGFTDFTQLSEIHYVTNTYDLREWAMYWECIVRMGQVDSYDHTDGIYDPRSDLGDMASFSPGIAEVVQIGREVGLYVAGKTVRLDSPVFDGNDPQDFYHMDYAGKTIPGDAESIFVCPGYVPWQNQLAQQCKNLVAQTDAKYIRVDEISFSYEPCYNPAHGHFEPYMAASSLDLLKKIREAVDEVDPNVIILTENPSEPLSRYSNGALCIWGPGPDIAPLRLTAPKYLGFSYYSGQVEAALNGFFCGSTRAGNSGGWATVHHETIWGDGLEEMPSCYNTAGTGDNLVWDALSHIFKDVLLTANCTSSNPQPVSINSNELENWAGRLWKTDNYWLLTCGNRVAIDPDAPIVVKLSELPQQISRGFEFDTKTGQIREIEIIRNSNGIFCSLTSGFSAVLFPMPQCPALVIFDESILLNRIGPNLVKIKLFAPWNDDISSCNVNIIVPGLTINGSSNISIPDTASISVPVAADSGFYYIMVKGDCLPAKKWIQVP